jgi:hypothetical protein
MKIDICLQCNKIMHGLSFKCFTLDHGGISIFVIISLRKIDICFQIFFFQKRLLLMRTQQVALVTTQMVKCSCFHTSTLTMDKGIILQLAYSRLLLPGYTNSQPMFANEETGILSLASSRRRSKLRSPRGLKKLLRFAVPSVLLLGLR